MTSSVRRRLRYWLLCLPCIYFALCPVMPCGAQATAGSILGRVTDASQAVVPFALVRAQNDATGLAQAIRTNSSGEYDLGPLPPGAYTLTVTRERFAPAVHAGLQLRIDQKMRVDVQLSVDPVSQLEVVTVQAPMLQTESAETGAVLELREIRDLPLLARNFLDLARLTSGVARGSGGNTLNLAVNGQREFANSVLVDGIEVSSNRNNDTANRPGLDSVEEFKVLTSSYPAEFGRAAGAIVAIQTTSGTNRFHGGLYEFFRPSATAASSFFATESSPLKQHNYGGTAGGPLRRDKTFFFFSYEGTRLRNAFSYLDSVPPAGQIRFPAGGADLSGLLDPATGKQIPIFDPNAYAVNFVAEPFPGNIIPAGRLSSPGKAILQNFFPAPNRPGDSAGLVWQLRRPPGVPVRRGYVRWAHRPHIFGTGPAFRHVPLRQLLISYRRPVCGADPGSGWRRCRYRRSRRFARPDPLRRRDPRALQHRDQRIAIWIHSLPIGSTQSARQTAGGQPVRTG